MPVTCEILSFPSNVKQFGYASKPPWRCLSYFLIQNFSLSVSPVEILHIFTFPGGGKGEGFFLFPFAKQQNNNKHASTHSQNR